MIIKSYELNKINLDKNKFILLYGKNEGLKNETINNFLKSKQNAVKYEEKEVLENLNNFIESLLTRSLFENEKIIIIKRSTDKIVKVIDEISEKKIDDIKIIFNSDSLEKKSKLRSLFEKDKNYVCIAFYPDTEQTLSKLTYDFFKKKNISISPSNTNMIVSKCNGDREALSNELNKMGHSVNANSLADLVKNMPMVRSINQDKITLKPNSNLTQFSKDATMDNEKKVNKLAKKTIDRDL